MSQPEVGGKVVEKSNRQDPKKNGPKAPDSTDLATWNGTAVSYIACLLAKAGDIDGRSSGGRADIGRC